MNARPMLTILAAGTISGPAAHAGLLSIQFAGGGNEITMGPSDTATLELVFQMQVTDTSKSRLTAFISRFEVGHLASNAGGQYVVDSSTDFSVVAASTPIPHWSYIPDLNCLGCPFNGSALFGFGSFDGTQGLVGTGVDQRRG